MKKVMIIVSMAIMVIPCVVFAMESKPENDPNAILAAAIAQRKEANDNSKKENFGDEANTVVAPISNQIAIDMDHLQNISAQKQRVKKEKKDKKKKKEKTPDESLADLEAGIDPDQFDNDLIARLKIHKGSLSQEEEQEIRNHLKVIRDKAPTKYAELQSVINDEGTLATRGVFGATIQGPDVNLRDLINQLALTQQRSNALQQVLIDTNKEIAITANKTMRDQVATLQISNDNMVAGSNLNKKWYAFMKPMTVVNSLAILATLAISIAAISK